MLWISLATVSDAADWYQFRGDSAGKVQELRHPTEWETGKNVAWTSPMSGSGWSSPVVAGDRIFLTSAVSADGSRPKGMMAGVASMRSFRSAEPVEQTYVVACLSLETGKEVWKKEAGSSIPPVIHPSNTYATESPVIMGDRLYSFFATTGQLTCWDFDGNEQWSSNLGSWKSGKGFGTGSSLAASDGRVFVQYDNDENSFVAAFDGTTGAEVWRDKRSTRTSWSTPLICGPDASTLVTCGSGVVTAYQPATGEIVWRLKGMESGFSASPAVDGNLIYFGNSGPGSAGPLVAAPVDLRGEVSLDEKFESEQIAWSRTRSGPGMSSPIVCGGLLYIPGSRGLLAVYEATSGERVFKARVPKMATVAASMWGDDERVFILDENGTTHVIRVGTDFEVLNTNSIDDLFWSTPAVAGESLLLRGVQGLYCVRTAL